MSRLDACRTSSRVSESHLHYYVAAKLQADHICKRAARLSRVRGRSPHFSVHAIVVNGCVSERELIKNRVGVAQSSWIFAARCLQANSHLTVYDGGGSAR